MLGLGRPFVQTDQPPRMHDDQRKKSSARSCSQAGPALVLSAGQHMGTVCGHSFIVGCMQRGAVHGSSFSVGRGAAHGSVCDLARRGVHVAHGGLCMCCDQREKDWHREGAWAHILYGIELHMFHAFRFMFHMFHLNVACVSSECCMCFI
jgi:hypothetical protein